MMTRKKKREEEARLRAEAEARARAEAEAKKTKPRTASWQKVTKGPVPVARPADYIQLTPIVQPIPLVPYSTQLQPLAMYEDDFGDEGYDEY